MFLLRPLQTEININKNFQDKLQEQKLSHKTLQSKKRTQYKSIIPNPYNTPTFNNTNYSTQKKLNKKKTPPTVHSPKITQVYTTKIFPEHNKHDLKHTK